MGHAHTMLSDQLMEFVTESGPEMPPEQYEAFSAISAKIKAPSTGRYDLDRAATMMVHNLTLTKRSSFLAALPLCRLREKAMWIEFAFRDRADWLKEAAERRIINVQNHPISTPPVRLGFLLEQEEERDERYLLVTPLWSHHPPQVDMGFKQFRIRVSARMPTTEELATVSEFFRNNDKNDIASKRLNLKSPKEIEASAHLESRIKAVDNPYWKSYWDLARTESKFGQSLVLAMMEDAGTYDLASEWSFVMSLLITINSRNVFKLPANPPDLSKLNKQRVKKGKIPLLENRQITLNLSKVQKRRVVDYVSSIGKGGDRGGLNEPCYIPGHIKVRKSGVFWWSGHDRSGSEPLIGRDYRVTA